MAGQDLIGPQRGAPWSPGCGPRTVLDSRDQQEGCPGQLSCSSHAQSWHVPCLVCWTGQGRVTSETVGQSGPESPTCGRIMRISFVFVSANTFGPVTSSLPTAAP